MLPKAGDLHAGYQEPSVGGGAVFFGLYAEVRPAVLGDINADLVNLYLMARDHVEALGAALARYQTQFDTAGRDGNAAYLEAVAANASSEEAKARRDAPYGRLFRGVRERFNSEKIAVEGLRIEDRVERAAMMVVLSKTCMNGLWRTNKRGDFNAPPGAHLDKKTGTRLLPTICDLDNLRAVSRALQGVDIVRRDMVATLDAAPSGAVVLVDPPYVPVNATANFVGYSAGGFTYEDQMRLAAAVRRAHDRGVLVAVANSDVPEARRLYDGFNITQVMAKRSINVRGDKRGPVPEILVRTWAEEKRDDANRA